MVDSHCHLADEVFAGDLDAVVQRGRNAGLNRVLCILSADEPEELTRAATVAAAWDAVRFSAGVHPHRAGAYASRPADAADATLAAVRDRGAVAIGEIGLDYHYDFAPRPVQQEVFQAQLDAAANAGLPVVIHTRESVDDTLDALQAAGPRVRFVLHCFTGTLAEARRALDLGGVLSFAGIVTFPKADALRDVVRYVPQDRLMVETDAPFLAPVPHRGKRNEPAWVAETLRRVAETRQEAVESLTAAVARTFDTLFGGNAGGGLR